MSEALQLVKMQHMYVSTFAAVGTVTEVCMYSDCNACETTGLQEVEATLSELGIPFHLLLGEVETTVPEWLEAVGAEAVVTDMT
jgi:deoxyribodipyrimidine photolyase